MLYNLMGKRKQYESRLTNEVRASLYYDDSIFYWQRAIELLGFRYVTQEPWGIKLLYGVNKKCDGLKTIDDVARLCYELDKIENGKAHADKINWYVTVKTLLEKLDSDAQAIIDNIKSNQEKYKRVSSTEKDDNILIEQEGYEEQDLFKGVY